MRMVKSFDEEAQLTAATLSKRLDEVAMVYLTKTDDSSDFLSLKPFTTLVASANTHPAFEGEVSIRLRTFNQGESAEDLGIQLSKNGMVIDISEFVAGKIIRRKDGLTEPIADRKIKDLGHQAGVLNLLKLFNSRDDDALVWVKNHVFKLESSSVMSLDR